MGNNQDNVQQPNTYKKEERKFVREQFQGELIGNHLYYWISERRYDSYHKAVTSMCDKNGNRKFAWGIDGDEYRIHPTPGDYIIEAMLRKNRIELRIAKIVYIDKQERDIYADIVFHRTQCDEFPRFKSTPLNNCLNNVRVRLYTDNKYAPYCSTKLLMSV